MQAEIQRRARQLVVMGTVGAVAFGAGTLVGGPGIQAAAADTLPAFSSCGQLRTWVTRTLADQALAVQTRGTWTGGGPVLEGAVPLSGTAAGAAEDSSLLRANSDAPIAAPAVPGVPGAADAVGSSGTGTNVQEAGVDEPDLVKTDGRHVVGVRNQQLWVATVEDHEPRIVGRLRLQSTPTSLLLAGTRVLVISSPPIAYYRGPATLAVPDVAPGISEPAPERFSESRLDVVDIADPTDPDVVASEEITGSVLNARQVGGVAWVVSESVPDPEQAALLPKQSIRGDDGRLLRTGPALSCTDVRHPKARSGAQLLTVQPVDINAESPFTHGRSAGVVAGGGLVYASEDRLYVATQQWDGRGERTHLHAFDISDGQQASYVGSGAVPGTLLSQWSLSEKDGFLRVATTTGGWGGDTETSIITLVERGDRLVRAGEVGGLGIGERVYAVRWLGDLAAVVTFRQTDPLYLVDLSNPVDPRVRGELKISGYSAYLHPVGDGLLLGVGQEADRGGMVQGAKAALFDVSNPDDPRTVSTLPLSSGSTGVEGDSHAFTYLPSQGLALLPVYDHGTPAISIAVDGGELELAGEMSGGGQVQRFLPVTEGVVALTDRELLDVDARSLDVLGSVDVD